MSGAGRAALDAVLGGAGITTTEGLTRTLRTAALPAEQRLALAWAMFDGSGCSGARGEGIRRLSGMLIRKNELLAEWLFSSMLHELKGAQRSKGALHRDPAAISLLVRVLESIKRSLPPGAELDLCVVLPGPPMALFFGAFNDGPGASNAGYVAHLAELWQFATGSTADGVELLSAQPDQLAQLLLLVGAAYGGADPAADRPLSDALRDMTTLAAHTMRRACETSFNPRKMFGLFDEKLLPLCLELACDAHPATRDGALDMAQAGLFHVECMGRVVSALSDKQQAVEGEQNYANTLFGLVTSALSTATGDLRARYAAALPGLLARYLQAATLVCSETRSMATTTVGLSAVAANPASISRADMSAACLDMFSFLYGLLSPHCSDERVLAATNQLVRVYFGDGCFGTTTNTGALASSVYQKQTDALGAWLASLISPVLRDKGATASALALALDGVDFALDAGPDAVKEYGDQVLASLSRVPVSAAETGAAVLGHLVSVLQKGRQLDSLVCGIAGIRAQLPTSSSAEHVNLLVASAFLGSLAQAVSQSMPHAQVGGCLTALADAIVAEAQQTAHAEPAAGEKTRKRRRVSGKHSPPRGGAMDVLAMVASTFVLASVATTTTEHQRVVYSGVLADKYDQLAAGLAGDQAAWARLVLHYAFVEAAAQIGGAERWLETCTHPERVRRCVLPPDCAGDPRTATLCTLVAFQAAAHWSVFAASLRTGIVPPAVSAKVDADAASAAASEMVVSLLPQSLLALPFAATDASEDAAGQQQGWGPWDGQAHTIDETNRSSAQWRLLVDWLDLTCEYAGDPTMHKVAMRLVAGLAVPAAAGDRGDCAHALLGSAGFLETARVREAVGAALAECALQMWQAHTAAAVARSGSGSSKPPKLYRKIAGVLEEIASAPVDAGTEAAAAAFPGINNSAVKLAAAAVDGARDKHRLSAAQGAAWIQLVQSLLRFPTVYWAPARAHTVLALAMVADFGISAGLADSADARVLQTLSRALLERLLQHTPALSVDLVPCAERAIDRWATDAQSTGPLAECSRRLVCLATGAIAQSAFGEASKSADSACRKACAGLYDRFGLAHPQNGGPTDGLVLEALDAVARAAQQSANGAKPHSGGEKWAALLEPWLAQTAQRISEWQNFDPLLSAGCIALHCTLRRLYAGAVGANRVGGDGDMTRHIAAALKSAAQLPKVLALALVLYAIHGQDGLDAGAPELLELLMRFISDDSDLRSDVWPFVCTLIAAIAGGSTTEHGDDTLVDAVIGVAIEPLLRMLDETAFATFFATCLERVYASDARVASTSSRVILAFVRLGAKQEGSSAQRQRIVQRHVGSILSALHAYVCEHRSYDAALNALAVVGELAASPSVRFAMFDVSESLAIVAALASMPLGGMPGESDGAQAAADLYCHMCRILSGIVGRHTGLVLDSVSLLVGILRTLLHAFVEPTGTERSGDCGRCIDTAATPWAVACAPLPAQCAEAYGRVLSDLCRARRGDAPGRKQKQRTKDKAVVAAGEYVKMTRGTSAAGVASVVTVYAPFLLAEYCVIQSSGAVPTGIAQRTYGDAGGKDSRHRDSAFRGLSWRPTPVLIPGEAGATAEHGAARGSIITSPAVREALLPGWYALLDTMTSDDRNTLLAQLAAPPTVPSVFGPGRHDGAHGVLKSLYQSYVDFYKFTGNV